MKVLWIQLDIQLNIAKLFINISIYKPLEYERLKKITQVYTFLL